MQRETSIMKSGIDWNIAGLSNIEKARLHVLFLCFVRFVVERHGGTMETDPETHDASIRIPPRYRDACFKELGELMDSSSRENELLPPRL